MRTLGNKVAVSVLLLIIAATSAEARSLRADDGGLNASNPVNGGWSVYPSSQYNTAQLPPQLNLPANLLVNPFSNSNLPLPVVAWANRTSAIPSNLQPTRVFAGWDTSASGTVTVVSEPSPDANCYDDAQIYPYNASSCGQGSGFNGTYAQTYYLNSTDTFAVQALNLEWYDAQQTNLTTQIIFFNLAPPSSVVSPGCSAASLSSSIADTTDPCIFDSFGNPLGVAVAESLDGNQNLIPGSGSWEIEFNCGNGGCANGASLVWDNVLYTATNAVLTGSSVTVQTSGSPQTTSAPNGDTLLNEFVYDGTTLWPPPGWVKTAIVPPTGVAAAGGNASATVSWTAAAGAASYNVYVGTTPGGESNTPSSPNVTGHSTPVTGLTAGATYYFQVTAVYNGVESARSTEIQATVPPSVPGGLQGTIGASAVTLSWSASQGATGYSIYRGASSGAETQLATGALTATSYTVANLAAGSTYYFFVVAVGAGGSQSGHSNEISKTLVPAAPASPSATAGDGSVTLNWTASTGATGYDVYEGTSAGGEGSSAQMTVTGTTATVTGLTDGTKYYFKIAAVDAGGPSAQSAEVSATPASSTMGSSSHGGGGALRWVDLLGALILLALRPARAAWQAERRIRNRRTALQ